MSECRHGIDRRTCSLCIAEQAGRRMSGQLPPPPPRTTTARFPGRCPGCDDRVRPGDTVGLVDDQWVCADCVAREGHHER